MQHDRSAGRPVMDAQIKPASAGRQTASVALEGERHPDEGRPPPDGALGSSRRPTAEADPQLTLAAYAQTWIDDYAGRTSRGLDDSTRADYRRSLDQHVLPRLGHHRLGDLRPRQLRALVRELEQSGQAPASIRKHLAALKVLLATAVEDDLLVASPGAVVRVFKRREEGEAREPRVLSRDERAALFAEVPAKWELFFRVLLHTGVRISEAIGLVWGDVRSGEKPRLEIRRQVCRGRVKAPKSRYGRREIPLSAGMVVMLEDRRAESRYSGDDDPIFASDSGGFLDASNLRSRILRPATRRAGLEGVGFHAFRHTCASLLFCAGKDLKQVQHWLGHHDPAFTLSTYIHLLDDGLGDANFLDSVTSPAASARRQRVTGADLPYDR